MIQPVLRRGFVAFLFLIGIAILGIFALGRTAMNSPSASPAAHPVFAAHLMPAVDPAVMSADPQVKKVAAASTKFGLQMLRHLSRSTTNGNVFFSPFSVTCALTMTLNGAGGTTARDMAATLGLTSMTRDQINHANGLLLPSLENPDPQVELSVASALWANQGRTFAPTFREQCRRFYGAPAQTLNFASPAAANTINGWVKGKTNGEISQLVTPPDISTADAVLTNAVYFHGQWQHQFEKAATQNGPFTLTGGGTKTLPMMSQVGGYSYLKTPQFQAVSLPYGTGRMSLYIFLPKAAGKLNWFLDGMNAKAWNDWVKAMKPTQMTVVLPRFKVDYRAKLNDPLIALGMRSALVPGANFVPMGLPGSFIGAVIHKAILEVDEEGTVAAAATAVIMTKSALLPPRTVMRINHPFVCAIRDNTTGTLLFAGVIRDPH